MNYNGYNIFNWCNYMTDTNEKDKINKLKTRRAIFMGVLPWLFIVMIDGITRQAFEFMPNIGFVISIIGILIGYLTNWFKEINEYV